MDYILTRIRPDDIDPLTGKATVGRFLHFSYFPLPNEIKINDEPVDEVIDWIVEQGCKWHVRATQRVQWIKGQCAHRHHFSFEDETVAVDFKLRYS